MSWFFPWSDSIKKRACRYLLQHYLGQFLKEKLSLDQLSVDLYSGRGDVNNVLLDVVSLNETLETYNVPFEIVDGYIGNISVTIPWSGLLTENTLLSINNLELTIQPKQRKDSAVPLDSMLFSSMTTSMQLAEECLKQGRTEGEQKAEEAQPFEGLEVFAHTIEAVLSKVKVCLVDSVIRLEHVHKVGGHGAAVEVKVSRLEYFDDLAAQTDPEGGGGGGGGAVTVKNFHLMGVKVYCDDMTPDSTSLHIKIPDESLSNSKVGDASEGREGGEGAAGGGGGTWRGDLESVPFMVLGGKQQLKLKLKQYEGVPGAKVELDCQIGSVNIHVTPHVIHLLQDVIEAVISPDSCGDVRRKRESGKMTDLVHELTSVDTDMSTYNSSRYYSSCYQSLRYPTAADNSCITAAAAGEMYSLTNHSLEDSDEESYQYTVSYGGQTVKHHHSVSDTNTNTQSNTHTTTATSTAHNNTNATGTTQYDGVGGLSTELSRVRLRVSLISVIVLHEDPACSLLTSGECDKISTPQQKLREISETFFHSVLSVNSSGVISVHDMIKLRAEYSRICPFDHIGLLCKPVTVDVCSSGTNALSTFTVDLSLGLTDLVEAVFERNGNTASLMGFHLPIKNVLPDYCELLVFNVEEGEKVGGTGDERMSSSMYTSTHHQVSSCVKIHYQHSTPKGGSSRKQRDTAAPGPMVSINLSSCRSELDITIQDRIHALLRPTPWKTAALTGSYGPSLYVEANQSLGQVSMTQTAFRQAVSDDIKSSPLSSLTNISISSPNISLDLRSVMIKVNPFSTNGRMLIQFPVLDLRSGQDKAWWKRNLSREILTLQLSGALIETTIGATRDVQQFSVTCNTGRGLFRYDSTKELIPFISFSGVTSSDEGFDTPRLAVQMYPVKESLWDEEQPMDESCYQSNYPISSVWCGNQSSNPTPFTSRKVMYESEKMRGGGGGEGGGGDDTPHQDNEDFQELRMPGDPQEMKDFIYCSRSNTLLSLDIFLPHLEVFCPDKSFLELLYNRLLNDLVLWEPLAPPAYNPYDPTSMTHGARDYPLSTNDVWSPQLVTQLTQKYKQSGEVFSFCKSYVSHELSLHSISKSAVCCCAGDGSDYDDDVMKESMYSEYSVGGGGGGGGNKGKGARGRARYRQSKMCVQLTVGQGFLSASIPLNTAEDGSTPTPAAAAAPTAPAGSAVEGERGEFVILCEGLRLFVSCGHNGDPECHLMSITSQAASLYHSGLVVGYDRVGCVDEAVTRGFDHLHKVISPTELTTSRSGSRLNDDVQPMLALAVQINSESFRNMKNYLIALSLHGATLNYRLVEEGRSWFSQILDFFDLVDFPIQGYILPVVVTEFYAHFLQCAIEYRPLYIPLRAKITFESFSISSNIIAESAVSVLRFVADDVALFIAASNQEGTEDETLNKDYVCIMNMGMFELTLRKTSASSSKQPLLELKASNDILQIHTCSDSFKALSTILQYLASEEDLHPRSALNTSYTTESTQRSIETTGEMMSEHDDVNDDAEYNSDDDDDEDDDELSVKDAPLCDSHNDQLLNDLSDAMNELTPNNSNNSNMLGGMDSVSQSSLADRQELMSSSSEMGDQYNNTLYKHRDDNIDDDDDDDFCILDAPGLKHTNHGGEPIVKMYSREPVRLMMNHFSKPMGRVDQLKCPDHFPTSLYRYTLREMSISWSMYGGRDFRVPPRTPDSRQKHLSTELKQKRYCGGPLRDLNTVMEIYLSKVRFQHDEFGKDSLLASRQVLLISDLEIRDKLSASNINKFLYLYSSESMPRQTHANMVLIKALHTRSQPLSSQQDQQECSLKISLQPLRLNIDQFFVDLTSDDISDESLAGDVAPSRAQQFSSPRRNKKVSSSCQPIISSAPPAAAAAALTASAAGLAELVAEQQLMIFSQMERNELSGDNKVEGRGEGRGGVEQAAGSSAPHKKQSKSVVKGQTSSMNRSESSQGDSDTESSPIFFKSVLFSPDVLIRLDYQGKRVDMEQGTVVGLVIGVANLCCSELKLKRVHHRLGLLGFKRLINFLLNEWSQDIKKNQIPSLLGGVGPLHSLLQLVQGFKDLVWLPVEQYRRDGRIVRGLQRGTHSFMTCTAMSTLELTNRLVQSVQFVAELAFDVVSPGPGVRERKKQKRKQLTHPSDLRAGVINACTIVKEGLYGTASDMYRVAVEEHEHKGTVGAVGGVLRHVPSAVIEPVIIATEATSNVLGGMRNQLLPDKKKEDEEKWKVV